MFKRFIVTCALLLAAAPALAENPQVLLKTSHGDITLKLNAEAAPISVENFLRYADAGHYDGLIFHRVIPGFMIQGGGFTPDMDQRPVGESIKNEADNGLRNTRYTVAMARTQVVDSATSQFFINLANNEFLNHGGRDFGYAVFAEVVDGLHVVETIAKLPTGNTGGHQNVPINPVVIQSVARVEAAQE